MVVSQGFKPRIFVQKTKKAEDSADHEQVHAVDGRGEMKEKDQIAGPEYFLFRGNPEPYKSEGDKNQDPPEQVV